MRWVVESSLRFGLLVVGAAAALMTAGVAQLSNARLDTLPEFSPPYIEIQTEALGLSAAEVEQLITVPLEADLLNGVAFLDVIRSESVPGLSSITLVFEPGTDPLRARQLVQERLTQGQALPNVSKPPAMLQPLSSASRVLVIGLSSREQSLIEQSVLARWTIRPRLMGVPGVANVSIFGQRERQLQVRVDPERLRANGVTLLDVITTTGNALWVSPLGFLEASTPGTGGFIDTPNQRLGIRHVSPIAAADDLAQVTVEGTALRLGEVAEVVEDHQPLIGDAISNDESGLLLVVERFPGANTLEVTRGVEAALADLQPGLGDLVVDPTVYRPATFVEQATRGLLRSLLVGFALLALVVSVLRRSWQSAVITLVVVPLSLIAAGLVLHLGGAPVNLLVVAGLTLALGAVIDDAIVDVDRVAQRLQRRTDSGGAASSAICEASLEVRGALVYATLILLLAVLPVLRIPGPTGAFLRPLALSYALAIAVSLLVALTVTPALSLLLLARAPAGGREPPLAQRLRRTYDARLAPFVARPAVTLRAAVAVTGVAAVALLLPRTPLWPSLREPDLLIQFDGIAGTSQPEMSRIVAAASDELRALPGVRNVGGHIGRAVLSDRVVGVNASELWVGIAPGADYDATVAAVEEVIDGYPGLHRSVLSYLDERGSGVLAGSGSALVVRVYGNDSGVLAAKAEEVKAVLGGIGGVVDPQVRSVATDPTVQIEVDLAAAQRFGIKPGDVRRATATLLSGLQVGSLFEEQKVFEVVVWGAPQIRGGVGGIRDLLIDTPGGGHVRLGDVAAVRIAPSPSVIEREAVSRHLDVAAGVTGRDPARVAREASQRLRQIEFPLEYRAEVVTDTEAGPASGRAAGYAVAAAVGAFLLLQAAFGSWRLASVTFATLPVALSGGAVAAALTGTRSLGSLFGFLTVLGVAARIGVALVRHCQRLATPDGAFGIETVLRATRERLLPITASTLATAAAFLPFALFWALPGHELVAPMAVVVLGGLLTTTLWAVVVVPALCVHAAAPAQSDRADPNSALVRAGVLSQIGGLFTPALLLALALALALASCAPSGPGEERQPAELVPIAGTDRHQVVLTEQAARRLGIQTAVVADQVVERTRVVGGEILPVRGSPRRLWVRVALDAGDLARVAPGARAVVLHGSGTGVDARPVDIRTVAEPEDAASALAFALDAVPRGLAAGQRVQVQVTLAGSGTPRRVVPYGAVLYRPDGGTFAYTNPAPLTFELAPIVVDYIEGDAAVLSQGPPSGTPVVTVGAAELYGAEFEHGGH